MTRRFWIVLLSVGSVAVTTASQSPQPASGVAEVRQLNQQGRFADGERRARELLAEAEGRFGPESLETAFVLDVLVESLHQGGKSRDPDALAFAQRALRWAAFVSAGDWR